MKIDQLISKIENCDDIISAIQCERKELVSKLDEKMARIGLGVVELDFNKGCCDSEWVDWRELREGDIVAFEKSDGNSNSKHAQVTCGSHYKVAKVDHNDPNQPICLESSDNGCYWIYIDRVGRIKLINRP